LPAGATLVSVAVSDGKSLTLSGERRGRVAQETLSGKALDDHIGKRAQRGRLTDTRWKPGKLA
jgi:topoisomerase IV subunit A